MFDNEHSLHLWKRHPCTSTVWRQLTDWCEQVTTWRDLRGLLYSQSDTVCLLIHSNCIELKPSINILIWVAWLFDHLFFLFLLFISKSLIFFRCPVFLLGQLSWSAPLLYVQEFLGSRSQPWDQVFLTAIKIVVNWHLHKWLYLNQNLM
jgi:hypothetical protein